jgi:hypothetical protein
MSSDGRFVAYQPSGSVLQVWDTFGGTNIYTNTSASTGILSPNGSRLLYFNMSAPNGIKVQDLVNRTNMLTVTNQTISHAVVPSPGVWSGDSRFVVVVTTSAISPSDTNQSTDIYLFDLLNSSSTLVSVNYSLSGSGNTNSDSPIVSWDGRYVIFRSFATNIVPGHTTVPDLYLFDRIGGTNCLLAASQPASDWVSRSSQAGISVDVSTVVFQSYSSSLGIGHASRMQDVFAAVLPPAAARDSDGDGIPDWWMIQYFGHAVGGSWDQSLAQGDPNGTGMTTQQDYIAGTNPTDPNSVFEASVAAPPPPGGSITLTWDAIPGRTYSVQYKDNLTDPAWQTLPGAPAISGNQGQMAVPADQPTRYYRIVVQ